MVLAIISFIVSCQKAEKNPINNPKEYIGTWKGEDRTIGGIKIFYTIQIGSNGAGSYEKNGVFDDESISGNIRVLGSRLRVRNTEFPINQAPALCEGSSTQLVMKVDGIEYLKN